MSLFLLEIFHIRRGRLCAAGHSTYMLLHFLHCIYCTVLYCIVLYCTVLYVTTWRGGLLSSKGTTAWVLPYDERTDVATGSACLALVPARPSHSMGECLKKYEYCTEEAQRRRKEKLRLLHARTPSTVVRTWQAVMRSPPSVIRAARPAARAAAPLLKEVLIGSGLRGSCCSGQAPPVFSSAARSPRAAPWCWLVRRSSLMRRGRRPSEEGKLPVRPDDARCPGWCVAAGRSARLARAQAPWQRLWWEGLGESGA